MYRDGSDGDSERDSERDSECDSQEEREGQHEGQREGESDRYEAGTCRICFGETSERQLVAPCACIGDCRLVHPQCLIRWQQQGHLRECEVCHSPWTFGLQANAAPPSREVAESVLAACQTAIRNDDRDELRRRLSGHVMQTTSGMELLRLALRMGRQGLVLELLAAATDGGQAAVRHAFEIDDYALARDIIQAGELPCPISELFDRPHETMFPEGPDGVEPGCPGNNSRVLNRVVIGDAVMIRIFSAYGVDLNHPRHRFGTEQLSPLIMAILYTPHDTDMPPAARGEGGKTEVVCALIECKADLDYCTDRSNALMSAIMVDASDCVIAFLHAGASTSRKPAVVQSIPHWALASAASHPASKCSTELLQAVVTFQLTGLTCHDSECFGDPEQASSPAFRFQHSPELAYTSFPELARIMGVETHFGDRSGHELRELGNEAVRRKDWDTAVSRYSQALMAGVYIERAGGAPAGPAVEADPEPHKVLANRSLAHLRLAQIHAKMEAEEASEVDARELLAAAATRPPKAALPPLPDLMEAVGPEERLGKKPNAQQASRGLRHSAAYRALAFSDAWRATRLAPAWAKAHARWAEAAYEIALACWARGDPHGVRAMRECMGNAYRVAASLEPGAGFVAAAMRAEKDTHVPLPLRPGEELDDGSSGDDDGPVGQLRMMISVLEKAGVSEAELASAGFAMPPADELACLEESEATELHMQLDGVLQARPDLSEKLRLFNVRRMQGGTDVPATREGAAAVALGAANEVWTMSYSTIGLTAGNEPIWAISIMDATPPPHRYADMHVGSGVHHGTEPPTLHEVVDTILRAIQYPMEGCGPPRRPRGLVLAWRMRGMLDAIEELAGELGLAVKLEDYEVALGIAAAHGRDIEGMNHGPGASSG